MTQVRGKRALVTGAARGIGRAIALALADRAAEVVIGDLRLADAQRTADEIAAVGGTSHAYELDVTDVEAIKRFRSQLHQEVGPIQLLVNNAGTVFGGSFLDVPIERHELTYRVNTLGMVAVTHAFLPDLIDAADSHLVQIVSASAFVGLPFGSTYASSKWAAFGFSESLRQELDVLGHRQVGVTAVCPGYVDTGLFNGAEPPKFTRMLKPESLAKNVLRAVERNRPVLMTPRLTQIAPGLRGLVPTGWLDSVGRMFGVSTSMMHWRGHAPQAPAAEQHGDASSSNAQQTEAEPESVAK